MTFEERVEFISCAICHHRNEDPYALVKLGEEGSTQEFGARWKLHQRFVGDVIIVFTELQP